MVPHVPDYRFPIFRNCGFTAQEYSERDWDQFHSPENLAKSVAIEAGELLECFQWGQDADTEEVKEEIADVMNYCLLLSDKLGIDAGKAVYDKLQKSAAKYPVEKCKGVSTKYDRL